MKYLSNYKKFNEEIDIVPFEWETDVNISGTLNKLKKILNILGLEITLDHNPPSVKDYYTISLNFNKIEFSILNLILKGYYHYLEPTKNFNSKSMDVNPVIDSTKSSSTESILMLNIHPPSLEKGYGQTEFYMSDTIFPTDDDELYKTVLNKLIGKIQNMTGLKNFPTYEFLPFESFKKGIIEYLTNALNYNVIIPEYFSKAIQHTLEITSNGYICIMVLYAKHKEIWDAIKKDSKNLFIATINQIKKQKIAPDILLVMSKDFPELFSELKKYQSKPNELSLMMKFAKGIKVIDLKY